MAFISGTGSLFLCRSSTTVNKREVTHYDNNSPFSTCAFFYSIWRKRKGRFRENTGRKSVQLSLDNAVQTLNWQTAGFPSNTDDVQQKLEQHLFFYLLVMPSDMRLDILQQEERRRVVKWSSMRICEDRFDINHSM